MARHELRSEPIELPDGSMPTWEDMERAAMHDAGLRQLVTMDHLHPGNRDGLLMRYALWAAEEMRQSFRREVDRLNREPMPVTIFSREK